VWKVWMINESVSGSLPQAQECRSEEQARRKACGLIRHSIHFAVLYIEKPDGGRIQFDDIKRWCDGYLATPRSTRC
jgi:hypothetical protein